MEFWLTLTFYFLPGGKITKSGEQVKLVESSGASFSFELASTPRLSASGQLMWEHFLKCHKHCQRVELANEELTRETEEDCFPLIVGRRPQQYSRLQPATGNKENVPLQSSINVPTVSSGLCQILSIVESVGILFLGL
jgi:hypothetical protein